MTTQLSETLVNEELNLKDLARVTRIVRSILPSRFDHEDIAVGILIESWSKHHLVPTYGFIRQRCLNELRSDSKEKTMFVVYGQTSDSRTTDPLAVSSDHDEIEFCMSFLTPTEKKVVWYRFFKGSTILETSKALRIHPKNVSDHLEAALYKMRLGVQP